MTGPKPGGPTHPTPTHPPSKLSGPITTPDPPPFPTPQKPYTEGYVSYCMGPTYRFHEHAYSATNPTNPIDPSFPDPHPERPGLALLAVPPAGR